MKIPLLHLGIKRRTGLSAPATPCPAVCFRRLWDIDGQRIELDNLSRFPCATPEDTGQPKVKILADHLRRRGAEVEAAFTGNEDPSVAPWYQEADWIICASNTVPSRLLC